ncbi:alpha/beta fold hydrolase [Virgibacillus sp. W0430]|uniref:alpha/beta fold hydrolase n=1 Tax=Virgibacillus sp. W0430 TaxID=3391580 RepID=UPI003F4466BC
MITNTFYSQENHGPYDIYQLGDFLLESGEVINNCKLAYTTFGKLNNNKDNVILMPTWFSGTSKDMEAFVGEERAINPNNYFIIIINQIGNGLSSSPHNSPEPIAMANFPNVTIFDDVRAQHSLITNKYGITEIALVVGGSMGAQQTYEWAVRYPKMVKRAAPIAGTAKVTSHNIQFTQTLIESITSDPLWNNGSYNVHTDVKDGLKRHANIWSVMGLSTEFYQKEMWSIYDVNSFDEFIHEFLQPLYQKMDPNNLILMARKWQKADVSKITNGDLAEALRGIQAKVFVLPIDEDMFFKPSDCRAEQKLIPNSELRMIYSSVGHFALPGPEGNSYHKQIDQHLNELLACTK